MKRYSPARSNRRRAAVPFALGFAAILNFSISAVADQTAPHAGGAMPGTGDPHAHHRAPSHSGGANYTKISAGYTIPAVTLRDQNDAPVALDRILVEDRPVVLQFIFTTCTTICPLLSASLSMAQEEIGKLNGAYSMVSISIDPEHDTPAVLRDYAARHDARANWRFLTGADQDIRKVIKAFGAYYQGDNKMYHQPYTFLRARPGGNWVRLTGFPSDAELVKEYRGVLSMASAHQHRH